MRDSLKATLYTVVNSNAMNGISGDSSFRTITPTWEKVLPIVTRVTMTIFIWSAAILGCLYLYNVSADVVNSLNLKNKEDK